MKTLLLLILLFEVIRCAPQFASSSGYSHAIDVANSICCFGEGSNSRIPLKRLQSYYWTSSRCQINHIVFVTKAGRHLCMNPENLWVQKAMEAIDKKLA